MWYPTKSTDRGVQGVGLQDCRSSNRSGWASPKSNGICLVLIERACGVFRIAPIKKLNGEDVNPFAGFSV